MELKQPPPTLPGFEPVATVHELPAPQPRRRAARTESQQVIPPSSDTTALIEAVDKVHRVVTARIAYHEAEARRLREALKPFADIPAGPSQINSDAALLQILDLAKTLREDTTPSD